MRTFALVVIAIAAAAATYEPPCDTTAEDRAQWLSDVSSSLQKAGWEVTDGLLYFGAGAAFGNNPSSLYGLYTFTTSFKDPMFQLNERDAVLFLGCTPPPAKYFSFRSYLFFKSLGKDLVFASLGDSMNDLVINTTGAGADVFERTTAVITTADQGTDALLRSTLAAAGFDAGAINTDIVPVQYASNLGVGIRYNYLTMLYRTALFENETAGAEYNNHTYPIVLLRAPNGGKASSYPTPPLRKQGTDTTESDLSSIFNIALGVLSNLHNQVSNETLHWTDLDGFTCIEDNTDCAGDNHDALYMRTNGSYTLGANDIYMAFGVNHAAAGKAMYSNFAVYKGSDGVAAAASTVFNGSVAYYAPDLVGKGPIDILYAYMIARDCSNQPFCLEISTDELPLDSEFTVVARAYLEPPTKTAPLFSQILPDVLLHFSN